MKRTVTKILCWLAITLFAVALFGCGGGGGGAGSSPPPTGHTPVFAAPLKASYTATQQLPLTFTVAASAPDGTPVTLSAAGLPPGATFDPATGAFAWTPALVTPAAYQVTFTAAAGGSSTRKNVVIDYQRSSRPLLGTPVSGSAAAGATTTYNQSVGAQYPPLFQAPFPGQVNFWDLDRDFSLGDGGEDQFDGALQLSVTSPTATDTFPIDQNYSDLTFATPSLSTGDGVETATVAKGPDFVPIAGTYSVWLAGTSDSRLQQEIDLTGASAPLTLSWKDDIYVAVGNFSTLTGNPAAYYRVVLRDPATGALLASLLPEETSSATSPESHSIDLSTYAGQKVLLSFETRGTNTVFGSKAEVDDVSLTDGAGTQLVDNGDFETGTLSGWSTNSPQVLQNVTSAPRTLGGLTVTRSFYTVPNQMWGRWVDVFTNNTSATIDDTVTYTTNLGSDNGTGSSTTSTTPTPGFGITYYTPGSNNKALTSWDGSGGVPDIGLVFGNSDPTNPPAFQSSTALNVDNGNDIITVSYQLIVPPGGSQAIVNFVIMGGVKTSLSATDASARATAIDTENQYILNNFWSDPRLRDGMTTEQLNHIANF